MEKEIANQKYPTDKVLELTVRKSFPAKQKLKES